MIEIERRFSDDTRLIDLTVGDLKELISRLIPESKEGQERKYVYGIDGISELFKCSRSVACRIKRSGRIDKALSQDGRTIIVDANLALELLKRSNR